MVLPDAGVAVEACAAAGMPNATADAAAAATMARRSLVLRIVLPPVEDWSVLPGTLTTS
jgi:hypothetical protein